MVYFVEDLDTRLIKIGFSDHPKTRINALKCDGHPNLCVLRIIEGDRETEFNFHNQFSDLRDNGEWFRPEKKLIDVINSFSFAAVEWFRLELEEVKAERDRTLKQLTEINSINEKLKKAKSGLSYRLEEVETLIFSIEDISSAEILEEMDVHLTAACEEELNHLSEFISQNIEDASQCESIMHLVKKYGDLCRAENLAYIMWNQLRRREERYLE